MNINSLWGEEFNLPSEKKLAENILEKISTPKKVSERKGISKKLSIEERITLIEERVVKKLGQYKDNIDLIDSKQKLVKYIDSAIKNKIISIDTETNNSLDPLTCKLIGCCIYTPNNKQSYVPINHINPYTEERLDYQLLESDIKEQFQRLIDNNVLIVMHNGKFDYQVISCTCSIKLPIYWDTMIGARMLDENERAGLKQQYIDKIDKNQDKYTIDELFDGVKYEQLPPKLFSYYASTDAYITYQLYLWQKEQFEKEELVRVYDVFKNVEMPLVVVTAEMELSGIELDEEYCKRLSAKYHKLLDEVDNKALVELKKYDNVINQWKQSYKRTSEESKGKSKVEKLDEPINLSSPSQLAILLYDILKLPPVDSKNPRGTGEEYLEEISKRDNINLCKIILERRGLAKLISTYIDKLPSVVNKTTKRLHCSFNQIGADTGRFSSSSPNMQNIPSHNKEIRMMFKAKDGYTLVGGDFSAQEPRLTSFYSQDKVMLKAYEDNKDLYSVIAQNMYGNKYEDNLEFYPQGTKIVFEGKEIICGNKTHQNKAGKERRSEAKKVLLGLLYGRGGASISEQLGKSFQEGQEIINKFFETFPTVKKWIDSTQLKARKFGYVEDFRGRRRRLPDITLQPYEISYKNKNDLDELNPFLHCANKKMSTKDLDKYKLMCAKIKNFREFEDIKKQALLEGIDIKSNTNKISQAERQCVNAVVQGGAATLTKMAMLDIYNDKELRELGFNLLLTVHDEVLGECPMENVDKVTKRLVEVMVDTCKDFINVPMKVDTYEVSHWYEDEYEVAIIEEFKKLINDNHLSENDAFKQLCEKHTESLPSKLKEFTLSTN